MFQTLLRAKENEVQYLKKEISCLQSEVQSLTKVCFKYCPPVVTAQLKCLLLHDVNVQIKN